jgi:hypothetical protein
MTKTLTLATIMIAVTLLSGTLGYSFSNPDVFAAKGGGEKINICHKPGTPAEQTLNVSVNAVSGHLGHGDFVGTCEDGPDCDDPSNEGRDECRPSLTCEDCQLQLREAYVECANDELDPEACQDRADIEFDRCLRANSIDPDMCPNPGDRDPPDPRK